MSAERVFGSLAVIFFTPFLSSKFGARHHLQLTLYSLSFLVEVGVEAEEPFFLAQLYLFGARVFVGVSVQGLLSHESLQNYEMQK